MSFEVLEHLIPENLGLFEPELWQRHWRIYKDYVAHTNGLIAELEALRRDDKTGSLLYLDRKRRLGFELSGKTLHEHFFSTLASKGSEMPSNLKNRLLQGFGSLEGWEDDLRHTATGRESGWVILFIEPQTSMLFHQFITGNCEGYPVTGIPLLVIDIWEHAYLSMLTTSNRDRYLESLLKIISFDKVDERLNAAVSGRISNLI
jgi:superoxide dismutase, Fe-Mn family